MKNVIVLLADGFEECEALITVDLLRRADVQVIMASVNGTREVCSSRKIRIIADALAEEVDFASADVLFLPGGAEGTANLAASELVRTQCRAFAEDKYLAAICAAPSVPASLGLLDGRKATCHPSVEGKMQGAVLTGESVTVDGNLITGNGLGAAMPFAFALICLLESKEKAEQIANAICYDPGKN